MVKTIKIGNKDVVMKATAGTSRAYSKMFGSNLLTDLSNITEDNMGNASEVLENLAYVMAKTADNEIPAIDEWLKQFDGMMDILNSADDLVSMMGFKMPQENEKSEKSEK